LFVVACNLNNHIRAMRSAWRSPAATASLKLFLDVVVLHGLPPVLDGRSVGAHFFSP
jgi:hypothetical protein